MSFRGAKAAVFNNDKLLVCLRDDKDSIPYPNMWDFPGGGREVDETPERTLLREINEEFGIVATEEQITYKRKYPSVDFPDQQSFFFVLVVTDMDIKNIQFGDEGQEWQLMLPDDFLAKTDAVPSMKTRLSDYLNTLQA